MAEAPGSLSLAPAGLLLFLVALGKLKTSVIKSAWPELNRHQLLALLEDLELVPVPRDVTLTCGQIFAARQRQGTPIGANVLWRASR